MAENRQIPTRVAAEGVVTATITVDGNDIDPAFELLSINVRDVLNRIAQAQLVILDGNAADEDFTASTSEVFVPGQRIEIKLGYNSDEETVFSGIIVKHSIKVRPSGNTALMLDCRAETIKMTLGRQSRYFYDKTDSDAIEELLQGYRIDASVASTAYNHAELIQYDLSDWDFLMARAEANGLVTYFQDGQLHCQAPKATANPSLDLVFGATILELDAEIDAREQLQAVTAESWGPTQQERQQISAATPSFDQPGNLDAGSLAASFTPEEWFLRHGGELASEELQAWADAQFLRHRLAKVQARVRVPGNTEVKPNSTVNLQGLGARFNGTAFVGGVSHTIKAGEWWTDIQIGLQAEWFTETYPIHAKPGAGLVGAVQGLQIAIVSQLQDDPDGEDRILVRMPIIDPDAEGIWARVATLDAGENRGSFFRPEIGDEVILGFLNGDPRCPVILGMLNSSAKPAPITASDDNHEKGFVTRSEMKLLFDDDKVCFRVETPNGHQVILDEDAGSITIQDQHGNKILLDDQGITLESGADINLKATGDVNIEGANVNVTAQAQAKIEGSAGAEMSSSGTTVVKGSLVQIN